ncbi:MAG: urease accessory protein UreF [Rhodospirillaceae bacterium]|nr:urease accessory protein UreF [Rhodospirillaceae bacterium]
MADTEALLRLQSWLSPAFPTGAFSYSHGLEAAVDDGLVGNADGLTLWLAGVLRFGTGRTDAWILVETGEAMGSRDDDRLADVAALAAALCGAAELSLESRAQGAAFLGTVRAVWPHDRLAMATEGLARAQVPVTLPVAVGMAATVHGLPMELVVPLYLNALAANMVSAGVRLVPLGQTDGQRVVAALEPVVAEVAARALRRTDAEPGSAALSVDLCAMRHETQYTRLFRS